MIRCTFFELTLFASFCTLYYTPLALDGALFGLGDPAVRELLGQALDSRLVRLELARNLLGHLSLLAGAYVVLAWLSGRFARAMHLGAGLSRVLFLSGGLALLASLNAIMFRDSAYSTVLSALGSPAVLAVLSTAAAAGIAIALWPVLRAVVRRGLLLATCAVAGLVAAAWPGAPEPIRADGAGNIVLIGVDSLSPQMLSVAGDALPNIRALVERGVSFDRAYTPLARTFPAWVSLLSGKPPAEHGAIFNLRSLDKVDTDGLVTGELKRRGYRTVLAIDERRFSNLDESFGFDRVVGPKVGALDFVLQRVNDTPLTNLFLQSSVSGRLLPFSRNNVASHANYDAGGFVEDALAAVEGTARFLLAVHFESAHFPFKTRHARREFDDENRMRAKHLAALTAVDAQVGTLIAGLQARRQLEHAMVVLVSDHGEGLGAVEALATKDGIPVEISSWGHGANLLSEHQSRVVLAVVRYRGGVPVGPAAVRHEQVSLADVARLIDRYAGTGEPVLEPSAECMFVETGIRVAAAADYDSIDESNVASESAHMYEIDAEGRLRLREVRLPSLVAEKDVGLRCLDRITLWSAIERRYLAFEIDPTATRFTQVPLRRDDVDRIEGYRARLAQSAEGSSSAPMAVAVN